MPSVTPCVLTLSLAFVAPLMPGAPVAAASEPVTRLLRRADYEDRLRGMWLGECLANWTGIRGEGVRTEPPFLRDEDWGSNAGRGTLDFVRQSPWLADDDTDIEYVYLHLMETHGTHRLLPDQVRDGWIAHINRLIWVSNAEARRLMTLGVRPPGSGMLVANRYALHIDAQLTTEMIGALCPGMPGEAIRAGDVLFRTTSAGFATHAAQFYGVLYALAGVAPRSGPARDRVVSLVRSARAYVPDGSTSADVVDFVLAEYLANPDRDDWERTRDRVYERYQRDAETNGFRYRGWTESTVNLATGVLALLYGEGDYRRTVRIGTLSGWDADNGTATMGGLLGLMLGHGAVAGAFEGEQLSDRYRWSSTRDGLVDHLPDDPGAEDTFTRLAGAMADLAEQAILANGGRVGARTGLWLLPPVPGERGLVESHTAVLSARSQNRAVLAEGGSALGFCSAQGDPWQGYGSGNPAYLANGVETDFTGRERPDTEASYFSTQRAPAGTGDLQRIGVVYDRPVPIGSVLFVEGGHWHETWLEGGWFLDLSVEVLGEDGVWRAVQVVPSEPLRSDQPFQAIEFRLDRPTTGVGVRLSGAIGGASAFITAAEVDALAPDAPMPVGTFDMDGDGILTLSDIGAWRSAPRDLDGDGDADAEDARYLRLAVSWPRVTGPR